MISTPWAVSSGPLGSHDVQKAASVIAPGNSAGIVVYENLWAVPLKAALRRGGGQLVASGRMPAQAAVASQKGGRADA
jgi:hypothetical protein